MTEHELLTPEELATRWSMSKGTLAHWRCDLKGPSWIKKGWMVLYTEKAVRAFEKKNPHLRAGNARAL